MAHRVHQCVCTYLSECVSTHPYLCQFTASCLCTMHPYCLHLTSAPQMTTIGSESTCLSLPDVAPGRPAWKKIIACFGDGVLEPSRVINRVVLGGLVFQDESKRKLLNSCTHPFIQHTMLRQAFMCFLQGALYFLKPVTCSLL